MSTTTFLEGRAKLDRIVNAFRISWELENPRLARVKGLLYAADLARHLYAIGYIVDIDKHNSLQLHVEYLGIVDAVISTKELQQSWK